MVDISGDSPYDSIGRCGLKSLDDRWIANVAGMPNLVTVGKMESVAIVPA
jgi:hypothetical protein